MVFVREPPCDFASADPDHVISLGREYIRPWPWRIVRSAPAADHCRRGLSRMAGFLPWWSSVSGGAPLVPAGAETQLAKVVCPSERLLQGDWNRLPSPWICGRQPQRSRQTPAHHGPGEDTVGLSAAHGGYWKHESAKDLYPLRLPADLRECDLGRSVGHRNLLDISDNRNVFAYQLYVMHIVGDYSPSNNGNSSCLTCGAP